MSNPLTGDSEAVLQAMGQTESGRGYSHAGCHQLSQVRRGKQTAGLRDRFDQGSITNAPPDPSALILKHSSRDRGRCTAASVRSGRMAARFAHLRSKARDRADHHAGGEARQVDERIQEWASLRGVRERDLGEPDHFAFRRGSCHDDKGGREFLRRADRQRCVLQRRAAAKRDRQALQHVLTQPQINLCF